MPARESAWATRQAWLAHFAVSDVEGGRFLSSERWSRGAAGLAGIQTAPFRVWIEDWSARAAGGPVFPMRLQASAGDVALDLALQQGKPPVLQGERGLSRKSAEPGNASYYYSLTRMPTKGTIRLGGENLNVTGLAWMDREWSTSSLGADQIGWDWFALQLADGQDFMLYQLRRKNGDTDPASSGTLVGPEGGARPLSSADFSIESLAQWTSPRSGAVYPARWRVRVPSEELDVEIRPLLPDQELDVSFRYWEGAVALDGTRRGRPVQGRGYVELTGYTDSKDR
jgi:predicted secreted hydrolase